MPGWNSRNYYFSCLYSRLYCKIILVAEFEFLKIFKEMMSSWTNLGISEDWPVASNISVESSSQLEFSFGGQIRQIAQAGSCWLEQWIVFRKLLN